MRRETDRSQQCNKQCHLCTHIEHGVNAVVLGEIGYYDKAQGNANVLTHDHHGCGKCSLLRGEPD